MAVALVATVIVVTVPRTQSVGAQSAGSGYYLTLAARQCTSYTDVRANRARNNIMESLKDLGPDTNYAAGEAISVVRETAPPQNTCTPIVGWQFASGTGIGTPVSGPWGRLSPVNGAGGQFGPTQASVPLRNPDGTLSGSTISGAVSVELSSAQFTQATNRQLWVQGGTRTDPVLDNVFPGQYGFAALRCAIDNVNGDNVEWIGYPKNVKHVLCYAYYVTPPPTSGTITVVKKVTTSPAIAGFAPDQDFVFTGNISYNVPPNFTLKVRNGADASQQFFRAGGSAWNFREIVPDGWTLSSINCTSTGGSTFTTNVSTAATSVNLVAGDAVTCEYTNSYTQPSVLNLYKTTLGGVGTFAVSATGTGGTASGNVTTAAEDTPAELDLGSAGDGPYTLSESLVSSAAVGTWRLVSASCDGVDLTLPADNRLPITNLAVSGNPSACSLVNQLDPPGVITVRKRTIGATESVVFAISPLPQDGRVYLQLADVTAENQFFAAQPIEPTDATDELAVGSYEIRQLSGSADRDFRNDIESVSCNGAATTPDASGAWQVTLTGAAPTVTCDVTDRLTSLSPSTTAPPLTTSAPQPTTPVADDGAVNNAGENQLAATGARSALWLLLMALACTGVGFGLLRARASMRRRRST